MREHFHAPDNYFLSHSVGCLPKVTKTALKENYFDPWMSGVTWGEWMPVLDEFKVGLAKILGVTSDTICPQAAVSSALTKILHSRKPTGKRNRILLSRQAFPTIGFVVKQAERVGYELAFIDGPVTDPQSWADAMDDTIAFVHATHALSNTSHLLPAAEICTLARAAGALSVIDAAQSTGVVPVRPLEWGADFVIGTGVKFLCFGPGACFLYAAKEVLPACEPIDVGWFSHENPFEMDIDNFRFAKDAMRFFGGTPSPAPLVAANAALHIWAKIGLERVHQTISDNLDSLCRNLPDSVLVSPRDPGHRGGSCVINPPDRESLRVALTEANILHDEREAGFRFSVHGYTSRVECENLVKILLKRV